MKKIFLIIFLGGLFIFPLISFAQCNPLTDCPQGQMIQSCCPTQGLVPCGTPCCPCQLCHLFVLLDSIVDFVLFKIILPLATLLLVIGGILFIFNAENPENVTKGKAILTSTVIGLIIIFAAWLIINSFVMLIGVSEWTGLREGWFQIECP